MNSISPAKVKAKDKNVQALEIAPIKFEVRHNIEPKQYKLEQ